MRAFFILSFALTAPTAFAAEDGWEMFAQACSAEMLSEWAAEVEKGKAWTPASQRNLEDLKNMSSRICPAYLAKRNDGKAIKEFTAKKSEIMDVSPFIERDGNQLLSFLQAQLSLQQAAFAPAGIDFFRSRCGMHMLGITERMKTRLKHIKDTAASLAATCFSISNNSDASAVKKSHAAANAKAAPALPVGRSGNSKAKTSDISGVAQEKAKRAK